MCANAPKEVRVVSTSRGFNVPVCVNGLKVNALVDTGAEVSLVRCGLLSGLPIQATGVVLVDAQGRRIATEGEVDLALSVGHRQVRHRFVVARVTSDILLGMDFLSKFGCVVDFSRNMLKMCGQWVPWQLSRNDSCQKVCSVEVGSESQAVISRPGKRKERPKRINLINVGGIDLVKAQEDDPVLAELLKWRKDGVDRPPWSESLKTMASHSAQYAFNKLDLLETSLHGGLSTPSFLHFNNCRGH